MDSKHTKNTIKKFENTEKKEQLAEALKEEEPDDEKAEDLEINPEELSKLPKGMIKHYKEAIKIKKNLRFKIKKYNYFYFI